MEVTSEQKIGVNDYLPSGEKELRTLVIQMMKEIDDIVEDNKRLRQDVAELKKTVETLEMRLLK